MSTAKGAEFQTNAMLGTLGFVVISFDINTLITTISTNEQ